MHVYTEHSLPLCLPVQWLLGLAFFLFPWASTVLRSWYLPLHVFFGLVLLAMAVGSSLMGITEKLLFSSQ